MTAIEKQIIRTVGSPFNYKGSLNVPNGHITLSNKNATGEGSKCGYTHEHRK
jgi:hypothetical protein